MSEIAVHCEARKIAYRQTKDGLVVSFVVHPNEMPDALAVAPLGQRYMLALAAIGDDEEPIPLRGHAAAYAVLGHQPASGKPSVTRSEVGKQRYASASDMEKALIRAARLPDDTRFRDWVHAVNADEAVKFIRDNCCMGESRKLIAEDRDCYDAFVKLETTFLIETNQMAEPR